MAIMAEGASAVPDPIIVRQPIEPKRSFIPTLTRLLPYWITVACFAWGIAIACSSVAEKGYHGIQSQLVDTVRTIFVI
jgi:hypothetical protein